MNSQDISRFPCRGISIDQCDAHWTAARGTSTIDASRTPADQHAQARLISNGTLRWDPLTALTPYEVTAMIAGDLVLRWMHILGAIVLVGGVIFMRYAYLPALAQHQADTNPPQLVRRRWAKFVMAATALLLISGLVNFVRIVQGYEIEASVFPGSLYHMLFGVKFLLALAVFFLTAALAGRSNLAQRLQARERMWLTVTVVLAVTVVLLAGMMKLAKRTEKSAQLLRPLPPSQVVAASASPGPNGGFSACMRPAKLEQVSTSFPQQPLAVSYGPQNQEEARPHQSEVTAFATTTRWCSTAG